MYINLDGLEDDVKPAMKNAMKYLQNAQETFYSMTIPSDFSYASTLKSMPETISNINTKVNTSEKWLENAISNFSGAESSNNNLLNNISSILDGLNISEALENTSATTSQQEESDPAESFLSLISDTWNAAGEAAVELGDFFTDIGEMAEETASNIGNDFLSLLSSAWDTACDWGEDIVNFFTNDLPESFNELAGTLSDSWSYLCENTILGDIVDFGECVIASAVNTIGAVFKGAAELVESLVDVVVFIATGAASVVTLAVDGISFLASMVTGDISNWEPITGNMWSEVMALIAEDHVDNAYKNFYENTAIGQWLDEHAQDWFKSDGTVLSVITGVAEVAGIIGLSILTAGTFGISFAASSAVIGGASAAGETLETTWGAQRDSSMVGIEEMHENGEISDEEYNMILEIRNLTDEDMAELEQMYKSGEISQEEYEMILEIRNMPEDWTTLENWLEGVRTASIAGFSEGLQWWLGAKTAELSIFNNKYANSALRIGIDTGTAAGDRPLRALLDSISSGQSFDEALEEVGGWEAVLEDAVIALGFSAIGEVAEIHKTNQIEKRLNGLDSFDGLDSSTKKKIQELIEDESTGKKININKMTDAELNEHISDLADYTKMLDTIKSMDTDSALEYLSKGNGKYGSDQGIFTKLEEEDPATYKRMKSKFMTEYGFSASDSEKLMEMIDGIGACNYARSVNVIFEAFKDSPGEFEEIFGFPLYIKNANGNWQLNDAEILADLYYWGNTESDEAVLIKVDKDGNSVINEDAYEMSGRKYKMIRQRGGGYDELKDYLASKSDKIKCETVSFLNENNFVSIDNIKNELQERIDNGEIVSLGVGPDPTISLIEVETGEVDVIDGGHWVDIIDVEEDGIIVSSWGRKCKIEFEDLISKGNQFAFISDTISLE